MEHYAYQQRINSSGDMSSKEKRPPLKRGQLKRQIVRTISNLVLPRNAAGATSSREKAGRGGGGFSREPSYN